MKLESLNNADLMNHCQQLSASERKLYSLVIEALEEVERRKLYLERGFPSLFAFCTEFLKYSAAAAQRRIESMRSLKNMSPDDRFQVKEKIDSGALNLGHLSQVARLVRERKEPMQSKERREILESLEHSSSRDCEKKIVQLGATPPSRREYFRESDSGAQLAIHLDQETKQLLEKFIQLSAHRNPSASREKAIS